MKATIDRKQCTSSEISFGVLRHLEEAAESLLARRSTHRKFSFDIGAHGIFNVMATDVETGDGQTVRIAVDLVQ